MAIINEELVKRANDNSMFNRGSILENEAVSEADSFRSKLEHVVKRLGGLNERQSEIMQEREDGWREMVASQYSDRASFEANNVSWVVAGPANYNSKRYLKRLDAMENRFSDMEAKKSRYLKNTEDMLIKAMTSEQQIAYWRNGLNKHGETIASDDPLAVEKMEAHIEHLKEIFEMHRKWNQSIRRTGGASQCEGMSDALKAEIDAHIKRNPYFNRKYFFTDNEREDIKNKIRRLEKLKKAHETAMEQAEKGVCPELSTDGLRLVVDAAISRVQLLFENKPDDDTRAKLKANGFRWSPSNGAWQRMNTPNGIAVAKRIFKELTNGID